MDHATSPSEAPSPEIIRTRLLANPAVARVHGWGLSEYGAILTMQEALREQRRADVIPDTWLAGEHPAVITQGVRGIEADLVHVNHGLPIFQIDRGGMTTLHNPGQLVLYPI